MEEFKQLLAEPQTLIMGVLNVTPDSFSDGGVFYTANAATERAVQLFSEGADIIDIGGQSTRPAGKAYGAGADPVSLDEELRRVLPVIDFLVSECPGCIISIDTTKAEVAKRAIDSGATIINDVSGGTQEPEILDVARDFQAPIILMHGYGPEFQKPSIEDYKYNDVVGQVGAWLEHRIALAREKGIEMILADIGFGFAKGVDDNITLLKHHKEFEALGVPLVLGVSRKSTIGKLLGGVGPSERLYGSIAAAVYGAINGAKIVRVHDMKQTKEALRVIDELR
ncbi:MAG TPA: dihydropteroate synthase [Candidatus Kapabacteria bacterium]|nr:dihydropteroate synthase [Candidatus Kapabacteria bacterium]